MVDLLSCIGFHIDGSRRDIFHVCGAVGCLHMRNLPDLIQKILFQHKRIGISVQCDIRLPGAQGGDQFMGKIKSH